MQDLDDIEKIKAYAVAATALRRRFDRFKKFKNLSTYHQMVLLDDLETAVDERLKVFEQVEKRRVEVGL